MWLLSVLCLLLNVPINYQQIMAQQGLKILFPGVSVIVFRIHSLKPNQPTKIYYKHVAKYVRAESTPELKCIQNLEQHTM